VYITSPTVIADMVVGGCPNDLDSVNYLTLIHSPCGVRSWRVEPVNKLGPELIRVGGEFATRRHCSRLEEEITNAYVQANRGRDAESELRTWWWVLSQPPRNQIS